MVGVYNRRDFNRRLCHAGRRFEGRVRFIRSAGALRKIARVGDIGKACFRTKITIADRFDSNMELYNEIQLSQGFDLRDFKGCEAVRYTYKLLNYPNYPDGVHLSFIVYNGDIIAGDIQSTTDSGFMHGIKL